MPENNESVDIQVTGTPEEIAALKEKMRQKAAERQQDPRQTGLVPAKKPVTDEEKGIRPVQKKPKKRKFGTKMKQAMFGESIGDGSITEHIFFKIFIPATKRVISDMANSAINMALGLDPKTRTISGSSHVANASTYRDRNYNRQADVTPGYNRRGAISEIEWDEETARDIYNQLSELIDKYGSASLSDAYSIMGMGDKIRSTDKYWGWTSMRNAELVCVDHLEDRWIIDMPSARPIN